MRSRDAVAARATAGARVKRVAAQHDSTPPRLPSEAARRVIDDEQHEQRVPFAVDGTLAAVAKPPGRRPGQDLLDANAFFKTLSDEDRVRLRGIEPSAIVGVARLTVMNLAVLKTQRRTPEVGDIFVMRPPDGQFLFGRVIDTDASPLGVGGAMLIYIYSARSAAKTPVPPLLRAQLLVAPIMTNKQPWTKGYFEHIENRALSDLDRLPQHCFKDDVRGGFRDERGNRLKAAVEPVGEWGLHSYRTIDDAISKALGIQPSSAE